jgi:hypothetical protein
VSENWGGLQTGKKEASEQLRFCRLKREDAVNCYTAEILTIWSHIHSIRYSFHTVLEHLGPKNGAGSPRLEKKQPGSRPVWTRDSSGGRRDWVEGSWTEKNTPGWYTVVSPPGGRAR